MYRPSHVAYGLDPVGMKLIQLDGELDEEHLSRELATGDTAWVRGAGSVWTRNGDGEVGTISPNEHPGFVIDGQVHAWHPDEGTTAADASRAGELGHLDSVYFACYFDEWIGLGQASSADEALDLLKDHLGVLDPSWIFLAVSSE